jgi:ribonuclease P protein component
LARAPFGLPRARRLRRSSEFEATARRGRKSRDVFFVVTAAATDDAPRLGIAVSRRVSGKAVMRNLIKRRIRESFRHHQQQLRGLDIVVVAQARAATATRPDLEQSLKGHWDRLAR